MKNATANVKIKIVSSALICLLGLIIAVLGLTDSIGGYYSGRYTSYESYGGDAYTGIQNAAADTAVNVNYLGDSISYCIGQAYILGGILIALVGLYLLGCNLNLTAKTGDKAVDEDASPANN